MHPIALMRNFVGFVFALALGLTGCGEDASPDYCGDQGQGPGAAWIYPGLYRATWRDDAATYSACVYVNENCTELEASTECNIGTDDPHAHFLEVEWTDGRTETGNECAAAVGVTTDVVSKIPIDAVISFPSTSFKFGIEFADEQGGDWEIVGRWSYDTLTIWAEHTSGDVVCRPHVDYPDPLLLCEEPDPDPGQMCLQPD